MLPDFPKSRKELSETLMLELRLKIQQKSVFAALARQFTQHEGHVFSYDQILDERKRVVEAGFEPISVPMQFAYKDVPELVGQALHEKIDAIADEIARQTSALGYRRLDESTREAGTAFDAGGESLSKELFLQSERARDAEFDHKTGKPSGIYLAHPDTAQRLHLLWKEWEQDVEFMKQVRELKAQKQEEWRDRESRRKLVD